LVWLQTKPPRAPQHDKKSRGAKTRTNEENTERVKGKRQPGKQSSERKTNDESAKKPKKKKNNTG
jgi:hypothetical protein